MLGSAKHISATGNEGRILLVKSVNFSSCNVLRMYIYAIKRGELIGTSYTSKSTLVYNSWLFERRRVKQIDQA